MRELGQWHTTAHWSVDRVTPMTHAPETGIENPYQKTCTRFLQVCHAVRYRFFRYRNLVRSRTMFYSVQQTVTKMTSTDWSDDCQLCCLFI